MLVGRPSDYRNGRSAVGALALVVPLLVPFLAGCSEPPSFELRWKLADAEGAATLETVEQCSRVGVSKVRVTTLLGGDDVCTGTVVDAREYPCFSSDLSVEGPTLEPGEYTLLVQGLRRTGEPWYCQLDDPMVATVDGEDTLVCVPDPEAEPCIARATTKVIVAEGSLPSLEVDLLSPPECDDGIDNDRDGRVDSRDPACILDVTGPEAADASVTVFQTSVSFLDSAAVKPFNVGVDALVLEVSGEPLAVIADYELDLTQWPYRLPLLAQGLDPGSYEFSITAVDAGLVPLTQAFTLPFMVDEDQAAFVLGQFDFTDDRFLEPIVQPISFSASLLLSPGASTGPSCELGGHTADNQPIMIERVWVQVTDDANQTLDAATLGLTGLAAIGGPITPVDEPGGWVSFECPSSVVSSAPLTWGAYDIEVQARIGAQACFSIPMTELAPQPTSAQDLYLERVLVDDEPAVACHECDDDGGCSGQICVNHVCINK